MKEKNKIMKDKLMKDKFMKDQIIMTNLCDKEITNDKTKTKWCKVKLMTEKPKQSDVK